LGGLLKSYFPLEKGCGMIYCTPSPVFDPVYDTLYGVGVNADELETFFFSHLISWDKYLKDIFEVH